MIFSKRPKLKYKISRSPSGLPVGGLQHLVIDQQWDDGFLEIIEKQNIKSICIMYVKLENGIEFLEKLQGYGIRNFTLQSTGVKDIRPLIYLKDSLEGLSLEETFTKAPDFTQFSKLTGIWTEWRTSLKSILHSNTVTMLGLDKYPMETLEAFSEMPQLEELTLGYGKLKSLKGIDKFPNLRALSIDFSRTLESLDGIQNAPKLTKETTIITKCKLIDENSPYADLVTFNDLI